MSPEQEQLLQERMQLAARLIERAARLRRLTELNAPEIILEHERRLILKGAERFPTSIEVRDLAMRQDWQMEQDLKKLDHG